MAQKSKKNHSNSKKSLAALWSHLWKKWVSDQAWWRSKQ